MAEQISHERVNAALCEKYVDWKLVEFEAEHTSELALDERKKFEVNPKGGDTEFIPLIPPKGVEIDTYMRVYELLEGLDVFANSVSVQAHFTVYPVFKI